MSFEWQAGDWLAWARTPGHDSYWYLRDAFFEEILPAPGRLTLEVGCGEGRVARDLAAHGHRVVALDASRPWRPPPPPPTRTAATWSPTPGASSPRSPTPRSSSPAATSAATGSRNRSSATASR
jgi:Methyltransferase domain